MTREDILVVEENAHLKHFIFDLVRCIDEGVPVANYFACADMQSGSCDNALLNAQKYIASAIIERQYFGGNGKCNFNIGDEVVPKSMPIKMGLHIADFVDVYIGENRKAMGVLVSGYEDRPRVFNVEFVNRNFELAE